jgi:hypothetical protein
MEDWAEQRAEKIIDAFFSSEGPDDFLLLQQAIAIELSRAYALGRQGMVPPAEMPQ